MGSGKPVHLGHMRPFQLSDQEEIEAFMVDYLPRLIPGFALLETGAKWGECTVDFSGTDAQGALVAIFPSVSSQEQRFLDLVARAIHAASWFEENKGALKAVHKQAALNWDRPLRVILVVQGLNGRSRSISHWLERSGIEVMEYRCYEFEVWVDERCQVLRGISLGAKGEEWGWRDVQMPEVARVPAVVEAGRTAEGVRTPTVADAAREWSDPGEWPEPGERDDAREPPPENLSIERFIASLADEKLQTLCVRLSAFFRSLIPDAVGVVNPNGRGFTLTVEGEHVASVYLDKDFLWIETGPERLPTGKIADVRALERVLKRLAPLLSKRLGRGKAKTHEAE